MNFEKVALFSKVLLTNPREGWDRLATVLEYRSEHGKFAPPRYEVGSFTDNVTQLSAALNSNLAAFLREPELDAIGASVTTRVREAKDADLHAGDNTLARMCYAICRAIRPERVVETGVSYGATTAHILQALAKNGSGHLWSVDLPPLRKDAHEIVGSAVPEGLKSRWTLVTGNSRRVLPTVLAEAGEIDIFIHDSLHTYKNELFEFSSAWPALRPGGVLISDDIESHPAWSEWETHANPAFSIVFQEDEKTTEYAVDTLQGIAPKFGVMIKRS